MFVIKNGESAKQVVERLVKQTAGYSGSQLARLSGLDKGVISRMRSGKFTDPALSTVVALAGVPSLSSEQKEEQNE